MAKVINTMLTRELFTRMVDNSAEARSKGELTFRDPLTK